MAQTTSIIQNVSVPNGVFTTVIPPANCFRCSITYFDDTINTISRGFISSANGTIGYTFVTGFETDGAAPTTNTYTGQLNQTIVMDRRGVGYMVDNLICSIKSTLGPGTFTFIWEIEVK